MHSQPTRGALTAACLLHHMPRSCCACRHHEIKHHTPTGKGLGILCTFLLSHTAAGQLCRYTHTSATNRSLWVSQHPTSHTSTTLHLTHLYGSKPLGEPHSCERRLTRSTYSSGASLYGPMVLAVLHGSKLCKLSCGTVVCDTAAVYYRW